MLRNLLLGCFLFSSLFLQAQKQVFFCDFSDAVIPEDFVVIEGDNLPLSSATTAMYGLNTEDGWCCTTDQCLAAMYNQMPSDTEFPVALTSSYYKETTTASDNWLITPLIDLSDLSNATLSWKAWAKSNVSYYESYRVLVSTTGNTKADFVDEPVFEIGAEGTSWSERTVDLSAYAGQKVYIAFHNNTAQGVVGDVLAIDNIKVVGTEQAVEESIELVDKTKRLFWEDAQISGSIIAGEFTNIKSFTATLKYGDNEKVETFDNLSVAPGSSYDFTLSEKIPYVEGENVNYTLTVNMNEEEAISEGEVSFAKDMGFEKNVVVEEITGTWCGNCVAGIVGFREMMEKYPDNFIGIAVHGPSEDMDPMTYDYYVQEMHKFIGDAYPKMYVDRKIIGTPNSGSLEYEYNNEIEVNPLCNIELNAVFDDEEMQSFNVEAKTSMAFSSNFNPIRLTFVLLENKVQGNSIRYSQANYYSKDNGTGLEMGGFENMPDPVPYSNIQYQHVARHIYGNFYGNQETLPDVVELGEVYEYKFQSDIPENVLKSKNLEVVALALDTISGEIVNAAKVAVELPTAIDKIEEGNVLCVMNDNGSLVLKLQDPADFVVELYSINGILLKNISVVDDMYVDLGSLESGLYVVRVKGNDFVFVRKVHFEK